MRKICFLCAGSLLVLYAASQSLQELESKRVKLPNGWSLTPAGKSLPLGDLPLNIVVSSSKKYMAVTNNGHGKQSIQLVNVNTEKILSSVVIPKTMLM